MKKSRKKSATDWDKVDAHIIHPHEYEELPELTDEMLTRADFRVGGILVRRGRPKKAEPKQAVNIRLDADVVQALKATGAGWQTRANEALRKSLKLEKRP